MERMEIIESRLDSLEDSINRMEETLKDVLEKKELKEFFDALLGGGYIL